MYSCKTHNQGGTGDECPTCAALAEAHHAIHSKDILYAAWSRVADTPIVKSMHSDARRIILLAILGE